MQKPMQEESQLLSRRQLCERWQVSRELIKRREKNGILPVLKIGRDARYRLRDVERIEEEAEVRR
jgi:predicted site-specific integrase-resolvase